jgi:hypothetical protein
LASPTLAETPREGCKLGGAVKLVLRHALYVTPHPSNSHMAIRFHEKLKRRCDLIVGRSWIAKLLSQPCRERDQLRARFIRIPYRFRSDIASPIIREYKKAKSESAS